VQGLVWGLITGDLQTAISISLVFELLWLDLISAGTFLPPNMAASNFAALALASMFGLEAAGEVVYPIILALPLGFFGARLEQFRRRLQNSEYNQLLVWTKKSNAMAYDPGKLIAGTMIRAALLDLGFFILSFTVLFAVLWLLMDKGLAPYEHSLAFGHLWISAALGGVLALRTPKAFAVAVIGGVCVLAVAGLS
jgi:PTS system mannose-specific IIC component